MNIPEIKKQLSQRKRIEIKIVSGSMEPVLRTGSQYWMHEIPKDYVPQRFDIFVYWNGEILIAHYFWEEFVDQFVDQQKYWVFRSLVNPTGEDFPVKIDDIVGRLEEKIPFLIRMIIILRFFRKNAF
jgi:hypothetical protein